MSLVTYEPWSLLQRFRDDFDRLAVSDVRATQARRTWVPAVDIHEYADRYQLELDIPGVVPEAIDVQAEDGVLIVSGEREAATDDDRVTASRYERGYGRFKRRFELPELADADQIEAKSSHGVLTVSIAKQAKVEPRRITVKAA